jgi:hypothetical protein
LHDPAASWTLIEPPVHGAASADRREEDGLLSEWSLDAYKNTSTSAGVWGLRSARTRQW